MSPATEGPVCVNHAPACSQMKQRASAVVPVRHLLSPGSANALCCHKRFAFGQVRSPTGEAELAAFGLQRALPLHRSPSECRIDRAHFRDGCGARITNGVGGFCGWRHDGIRVTRKRQGFKLRAGGQGLKTRSSARGPFPLPTNLSPEISALPKATNYFSFAWPAVQASHLAVFSAGRLVIGSPSRL